MGRTHCKFLEPRLYPTLDPTLNSSYSIFMKKRCSLPKVDLLKYVRNDEITPMKIDNNYFKNIMQLKGSLKLDNALYLDNRTKVYVEKFAQDNNYFFSQFVEAISIISEYKVLTGSEGEIRRNCKWVNWTTIRALQIGIKVFYFLLILSLIIPKVSIVFNHIGNVYAKLCKLVYMYTMFSTLLIFKISINQVVSLNKSALWKFKII